MLERWLAIFLVVLGAVLIITGQYLRSIGL